MGALPLQPLSVEERQTAMPPELPWCAAPQIPPSAALQQHQEWEEKPCGLALGCH